MKNMLRLLIILVTGAVIGYALPPSVKPNEKLLTTNNNRYSIELTSQRQAEKHSDAEKSGHTTFNTKLAEIDEENRIEQAGSETSDDIEHYANTKNNSTEQQLLLNWSESHIDKLTQAITNNVPTLLADFMLPKVLEDNDFLTNNTLKQSTTDDETWAYNMEIDLSNAITQHPASSGFNLIQLTCKQLACEILGIATEDNAWNRIYINILQTIPKIVFPDINTKPKSIQFREGNSIYIYTVIDFKKATD